MFFHSFADEGNSAPQWNVEVTQKAQKPQKGLRPAMRQEIFYPHDST